MAALAHYLPLAARGVSGSSTEQDNTHTVDFWSEVAATTTPMVKSVTATTCIRENLFPQRYPAARVVILPPDRRMMCMGTEIL